MELISVLRFLIQVGVVICMTEVIASLLWWPFYFRRGIQVYRREILGELESTRQLSDITACSNTGLLFHTVNAREVIFRDPLVHFSFKAKPMMHGSVIYHGAKFELLGLANWTPMSVAVLAVLFGVFGVVLNGPVGLVVLVVPGVLLTILVWSYQAQKRRLDDLVDEINANLKSESL